MTKRSSGRERTLKPEASGSPAAYRSESTPPSDELLTQPRAAELLKVSVSYLRASDCPKVLLPSNGQKSRPIVRYRRSEVLAWCEHWTTRASIPQRRSA
jgi:hypothetical protein